MFIITWMTFSDWFRREEKDFTISIVRFHNEGLGEDVCISSEINLLFLFYGLDIGRRKICIVIEVF